MSEKLMTTGAVAAIVGVDPRSIQNWCAAGKGPPFAVTAGGSKGNGHLRFEPAAVALWLEAKGHRVPKALQRFLGERHRIRQELLTAIESMNVRQRQEMLDRADYIIARDEEKWST